MDYETQNVCWLTLKENQSNKHEFLFFNLRNRNIMMDFNGVNCGAVKLYEIHKNYLLWDECWERKSLFLRRSRNIIELLLKATGNNKMTFWRYKYMHDQASHQLKFNEINHRLFFWLN